MNFRGAARRREARGAGIALLILGLLHTPLPQPDYHNIRHHDAPGEVCEHHDHLLRWHPGAGLAEDVAVLHWHWLLPGTERTDAVPHGTGAALHAHVADWQASTWDDGPQVVPGRSSTLVGRAAAPPLAASSIIPPVDTGAILHAPGPRPLRAFSATFAPHATFPALFQRWAC